MKVKINRKRKVRYSCAVPIRSCLCTAWLLNLPGEQRVLLWHQNATIQDVHGCMKVMYPNTKFTLGRLDVGELKISEIINTFRGDGRYVTENWEVTLDGKISR